MDDESRTIVEHFMRSATIPLLYQQHNKMHSMAGGTLFKIQNRHFIITVRHIFDHILPGELAYPADRMRGVAYTVGKCEVYKPLNEKTDIAVMELFEPETVKRLEDGWNFLGINNVGRASDESTFALMGYPSELSDQNGTMISAKGIVLYSKRILVPPSEAPDPNPVIDLFFEYKKAAFFQRGQPVATPKLPGTSGCSVWEVVDSTGSVWLPESCAKVVGVQSAYHPKSYFRAVRWTAVAELLGKIDPQLATAVRAPAAESV